MLPLELVLLVTLPVCRHLCCETLDALLVLLLLLLESLEARGDGHGVEAVTHRSVSVSRAPSDGLLPPPCPLRYTTVWGPVAIPTRAIR